MKRFMRFLLAGILVIGEAGFRQWSCWADQAANGAITIKELSCEYAQNPLGIDTPAPRFSWRLESSQRGQMQSAYRIRAASSEQKLQSNIGDKWDSGKVVSENSVNISYQGEALSSGEKCYWQVRVWDQSGKASPWSKPATFEMGLLKESDWQGKWIRMAGLKTTLNYFLGKFGQAIHLDGEGQSVEIPYYSGLKPAEQITFSAWVKPRGIGTRWQHIYRKEDDEARQVFALGDYPNDISGLWIGLGIAGSYVEKGAAVDTVVLTDGNWHLAAATYDGSSIKLYFDGAEIGSWQQTGTLDTPGSNPGYIGSMAGRSEYFEGGIDDVRIYSRALSASELHSMAGGVGVASDLVGWWKLDGNLTNSAGGRDGEEQVSRATAVSPLLRKDFHIPKKVKRARAYISGLGWYELYINGNKVGDHVLDPAATDYDKQILYVTYDVTDLLNPGENAVGIMLGNGWYCEPEVWRYGTTPRVLIQINVEFSDGSSVRFVTDGTWKASTGPIIHNDIWNGETYDARLEKHNWSTAGFDDADWRRVKMEESPGGKLVSQLMPPIKVMQTIKPIKSLHPKPGVYVYDMGQLFGGWARVHVKGQEGAKIAIKYSGRIFAETGFVDKRCYPAPLETDYYILKGDPQGEVYEPRFTFHPLRYVQIEFDPNEAVIYNLEGRVVHSSVDLSGRFHCSNPLLNKM